MQVTRCLIASKVCRLRQRPSNVPDVLLPLLLPLLAPPPPPPLGVIGTELRRPGRAPLPRVPPPPPPPMPLVSRRKQRSRVARVSGSATSRRPDVLSPPGTALVGGDEDERRMMMASGVCVCDRASFDHGGIDDCGPHRQGERWG